MATREWICGILTGILELFDGSEAVLEREVLYHEAENPERRGLQYRCEGRC